MLEHVRDSVLKFKSYEITTCAIGYLRQTIMFPKNNDLMLNTRIKQVVVEVENIMIKLETAATVIMINIISITLYTR